MSSIDTFALPAGLPPVDLWACLARSVRAWLDQRDLPERDAVVVVPFAELLVPCRTALAVSGRWMPRVETLRTLAASLGPAEPAPAEAPCGDRAIDQLLAGRWMASLPGLRDWRRRDARACEQATADVVDAAHALMRASTAQVPDRRAAWWQMAVDALSHSDGPGALEAALGRLAVQWASLCARPATDRLHEWTPSAWIVLQAGGIDPLAQSVLSSASSRGVPCLRLSADAASIDPFDDQAGATPTLWSVPSAENEAWAAAGAAIEAVSHGDTPVAMIAQDRLLVRRIRALLERRGLQVADESGWALSTTRAASHLVALMKATRPSAGPDAWLDGLKACAGSESSPWLDDLERLWRRAGVDVDDEASPNPGAFGGARPDAALARWQAHRARWKEFAAPARRSLKAWLMALAALADDLLPTEFWRHDPAAESVRAALRLDLATVRGDVDTWPMDLDDFIDWSLAVLEQSTFIDPVPSQTAQVVITPLARAMLRPFGRVVLPGADERQLGVPAPTPALLPEAMLRQLGMDDRGQRHQRAALAFTQLLRHPGLVLLRRCAQGSEPVGASRWIDRLQAARAATDRPWLVERDAPSWADEALAQPVAPPSAVADGALPDAVSASSVEALRACPYRFFARSVLGLSEAEELEADPGKRDFGSLLHEALHRFHETRIDDDPPAQQAQQLVDLAKTVAQGAGLDGPAMLPFAAGLTAFAERYLAWLATRDAIGWRYEAGELEVIVTTDAIADLRLRGRIDRIDRWRGSAVQLIDYKTGSASGLREKLRDPLEDTQLAFYAAQLLLQGDAPAELSAAYLALDERKDIEFILHADVADSARLLLQGLAEDWRRLRGGAPMRALGEGAVCDTCEARGLCRRDHWADDALAPNDQGERLPTQPGHTQ